MAAAALARRQRRLGRGQRRRRLEAAGAAQHQPGAFEPAPRRAAVALGATVLLTLAMWTIGRPVPVGLIYSAWVLGPPLALAAVLFSAIFSTLDRSSSLIRGEAEEICTVNTSR